MYQDLPNVDLIEITNDYDVNAFLKDVCYDDVIKIGFEHFRFYQKDKYFDKAFYSQFNLPIETKWKNFYVNRNLDNENKLFNSLNIEKNKYIFLHESCYKINRDFIETKSLPIIEPHKTETIFDWCTVIENAAEIHCICSSFKHLADNLNLETNKLYYHISYVNKGQPRFHFISYNKNNWKIL